MTIYNRITNSQSKVSRQVHLSQVKNDAGGFVFEIDAMEKVERFLALGTIGGTYYAGEQTLTEEFTRTIISAVLSQQKQVVDKTVDYLVNKRCLKVDNGLYVLSLCIIHGNEATRIAAYAAIPTVCVTATHLFTLLEALKEDKGWSAGLRKAVSRWYNNRSIDSVSVQILKYRQRNNWTHRDVLRLAHPKADSDHRNLLYKFIVGKIAATETMLPLLVDFTALQECTDGKVAAKILNANHAVTWEMVPTGLLNDKDVLTALIKTMPYNALLRNLSRFSKAGLTKPLSSTELSIISALQSKSYPLHPVVLLNYMNSYSKGSSDRNDSMWTVSQRILEVLETQLNASFVSGQITGNVLLAVDNSGSMGAKTSHMSLTCVETASVLIKYLTANTPNLAVTYFNDKSVKPKINKHSSLKEIIKDLGHAGGTDCSIPFKVALDSNVKFDCIVVLTDSQTWHGDHPIKAFEAYRNKVNKDVKCVIVGMESNTFSLFPSGYKNTLNIAGFDASTPEVLNAFIKE